MSDVGDGVNGEHCANVDDVAVYVLGALPPAEAARVRAHIETCAECREEFQALQPAAAAIGSAATMEGPSELLKTRIMRQVRTNAGPSARPATTKSKRSLVWPAYLVAAACLAFAVISTLINLSLVGQLKADQNGLAQARLSTRGLASSLAMERSTLADLMSPNATHFPVDNGEIVRLHDKLYITLHDVPKPPQGHVYQAWTQAKGAKVMTPSVTFIPDRHGVAIVSLPVDAARVGAVAVSVEPDGGSKAPTTKPILVTSLD